MYSDEEVFNTVNKITNTKSLFSMSGFSTKESPYKEIKKRGVNSERAEVIEHLCKFMDNDTKRFKYWLGRTKHLSPAEIHGMIKQAKGGKNPQALFNYFLKKK